jgi:hypothetical protein
MHDRLRESFGGWLPARIESYNSTTNRAAIQLLLYDDYEDEEGERQIEPFPVVDDIPVGWLSLGGKFCLRSTVTKGDEGMYLMPARPTTKWLQTGGMVDPEDDDHHTLDGGVFLPYRISVGGSDATAMIEITASSVNIGGTSNLVTRAEFLDHTHLTAGTGAPSPATSIAAPGVGGTTAFPGTQKLKGG